MCKQFLALLLTMGLLPYWALATSRPRSSLRSPPEKKKPKRYLKNPRLPAKQRQRRAQFGHHNRIVGGTTVDNPDLYPFFAWFEVGCGATLIHSDILLTAGHCLDNPFERRVWIGGVQLEKDGEERSVVARRRHPLYHDDTTSYDFMVMKLNQPSDHKPAPMNRDGLHPSAGDELTVVGFGTKDEPGYQHSETLQEVVVHYVEHETCQDSYLSWGQQHGLVSASSSGPIFKNSMFCAGIDGGGYDSCQGDSGGPALDSGGEIVGIVSWGEGCGLKNYPGVYARVSSAAEWIDEQICRLSSNPPTTCNPNITSIAQPSDGNAKNASMTVSIILDNYPEENAWSFSNFDTGEEIYFADFGDLSTSSVEMTFDGLPAGRYQFMIGDEAQDGICCYFGNGRIAITNGNGDTLWTHSGNFDSYLEAVLEVDGNGNLLSVTAHPEEVTAPSVVASAISDPSIETCSFTVDIMTDLFPDEISWSLESVETREVAFRQLIGEISQEYGVVSKTIEGLPAGNYKFEIEDVHADGIDDGWIKIRSGGNLLWTGAGNFYDYLAIHIPCEP